MSHLEERLKEGLPPLPLNPEQTAELIERIKKNNADEIDLLIEL